jgi:hypothetical protein
MSTTTHQVWLCAYCLHVNPTDSPDAETPAVTFVQGTAACAEHARANMGPGRMRHD